MKIYMRRIMGRCAAMGGNCSTPNDPAPIRCSFCEAKTTANGLPLHGSCRYLSFVERVTVKEAKTIDINEVEGYIQLGRNTTYRLEDLSLLKVDYEDGRGYVLEWGEEEGEQENAAM